MKTVERKDKLNIQISLDPFLLFILTSVFVHGLGILILVLSDRSIPTAQKETESTPIDFIVVPPEETIEEPPPETKNKAVNNSVAKGKVQPELLSATNKIGNETTITSSQSSPAVRSNIANTPANPVVRQTPPPPKLEPTPRVQPVTPSPPLPQVQKPATPPLPSNPKPVTPPPSLSKAPKPEISPSTNTILPEEVKPNPTVVPKPKPIEKAPLLSEFNPRSIPLPKIEPLPEKKPPAETEKATPQPDIPPVATKLPPKLTPLKPSNQSEEILPKQPETTTPQPDTSPVATKSPPSSPPVQTTESTSVPATPTTPPPEQQTPVGSGSASLLGGTYRKSVAEDSGGSFFKPEANASQQALNSSGADARQDLNMGPYFAEIRRRVKRNWQPSTPPDHNRHTVLVFSIQRNGQITGLRVRQSSGISEIDRESIEAVQKAGPFAALPADYPDEQLDIVFNFNLYLHQGVLTPQLENWQRF